MSIRHRLQDWRLRLGLNKESNPHVGRRPSHEDLARARSFASGRDVGVEPDEDELSDANSRSSGQ